MVLSLRDRSTTIIGTRLPHPDLRTGTPLLSLAESTSAPPTAEHPSPTPSVRSRLKRYLAQSGQRPRNSPSPVATPWEFSSPHDSTRPTGPTLLLTEPSPRCPNSHSPLSAIPFAAPKAERSAAPSARSGSIPTCHESLRNAVTTIRRCAQPHDGLAPHVRPTLQCRCDDEANPSRVPVSTRSSPGSHC